MNLSKKSVDFTYFTKNCLTQSSESPEKLYTDLQWKYIQKQ